MNPGATPRQFPQPLWEYFRTATAVSTHPATCGVKCHSETDIGPIDAVITWVDGDDPAHKAKLAGFLGTLEAVPEIASADRYRESGEFAYCIASLLRFAPWLRRIHIVTDAQEPAFMPALRASPWRDKIVVVDHTELFAGYEQHLPTFNNRTLLSALWRIPGLAPRFIYLNDDFALLRPVSPEDFFRNGKIVLRGSWRLQPWRHEAVQLARRILSMLGLAPKASETRPSYHRAQALAARAASFRWRYFRVPHEPHAQLRLLSADYFTRNPERFEANIRHRLRASEQLLADALCNHLALRQGRAVIDNQLRTLRLKSSHYRPARLERLLETADRDTHVAFACFQDLESLAPERRTAVFRWLERRIGRPESIFGSAACTA